MDDYLKYRHQVHGLLGQYIAHKKQLAKLIQELDDYPELAWSEKWNSRMYESLASILQVWQTAESMVPPPRLSRFHETWLEAADHEHRAAELIANHVALTQQGRPTEAMMYWRQAMIEFDLCASAIDRAAAMFSQTPA